MKEYNEMNPEELKWYNSRVSTFLGGVMLGIVAGALSTIIMVDIYIKLGIIFG